MDYDHKQIEERWLAAWEEAGLFQGVAAKEQGGKEKLYLLFAFAYPSGSGLHVGHVESGTALDIMARYYRMNGKNVFFPVGWDAFGLPAENYAIKTGVHPAKTTKRAINTFRRQIKRIGISYDWETEIATNHPEYYKWTQWLFLKLYEKGLAYKDLGKVNWCPSCVTVLANEQVVEGKCERCGTLVEQKAMEQWFFKITDYKDQLIDDLQRVDWPKPTIEQQNHWIGRQKGVEVGFQVKGWKADSRAVDSTVIRCFTTRIDTIYGVTFLVVSPEYLIDLMRRGEWQPSEQVAQYLDAAMHKTEEERRIGEKDKTGEDTGLVAINPVNGDEVPIYVADYVLAGYGTGAVMGVPAHDERDKAFATKFGLPIVEVIKDKETEYGTLVNSGEFDGMTSEEAMEAIPAKFPEVMKKTTTYKLRDWLISRQRYWGAPIPIVYDPEGNPHPVKEEHLPWLLPTDVDFKPTGESPLKSSKEFVERVERLYGEGWRPEYDTMDTFVDSSWYYLRYTDARNSEEFARKSQLAKLMPVDFYMIGPEHIVLHLLYSRFFTKFLRDQGYVSFDEPFLKMRHQGMILGPDGRKMSKSKGNVVDPDEVIEQFGADTLRLYEMFMGPLEADKPWNTTSVQGVYRFVKRLYRLMMADSGEKTHPDLARKLHWALDKVTKGIPMLKFNTSIAALMELVNVWVGCVEGQSDGGVITVADKKLVARMVAPMAPFLAEELWQRLGDNAGNNSFESVHEQVWPQVDQQLLVEAEMVVVVAVNGKPRHTLLLPQEQVKGWTESDATVLDFVATLPQVGRWIEGKEIRRVVFVLPQGKNQAMVNLVV